MLCSNIVITFVSPKMSAGRSGCVVQKPVLTDSRACRCSGSEWKGLQARGDLPVLFLCLQKHACLGKGKPGLYSCPSRRRWAQGYLLQEDTRAVSPWRGQPGSFPSVLTFLIVCVCACVRESDSHCTNETVPSLMLLTPQVAWPTVPPWCLPG